jgi:hypothetical protein
MAKFFCGVLIGFWVVGGGKGGEITQTLYAYMNKIKIKKKRKKE